MRTFALLLVVLSCTVPTNEPVIQTVTGPVSPTTSDTWLTHEHLLVDFVGADSITPDRWNDDLVFHTMKPYLDSLTLFHVGYLVDATPNFLGRDVALLRRFSEATGIRILTNTGLYAAVGNKYIPDYAFSATAEELANQWIDEFESGIDGTGIKPGFIKISVNASDPLSEVDSKIVRAAALTHLQTGLTIGSHTGKAEGLYPQLAILKEVGVSPEAFIWIHAQNEDDPSHYLKAAELGCWISLDGLGWEMEKHVEKLVFAKENGILDHILISHDAGWYDPAKSEQAIVGYTAIFTELIPTLKKKGFSEDDIRMLLAENPVRAFGVEEKGSR